MKRELLILRHAKSDWGADYTSDHERPLAPRGLEATGIIGRFLQQAGPRPDHILSSSALRARTTAELVKEAAGWTCDLEVAPDLYGASVERWLGQVAAAPPAATCLVVAGHEPTCSEVIGHLTGASVRFPTAAVASLRVWSTDWQRLQPGTAELAWLVKPKLLGFLARPPGGR